MRRPFHAVQVHTMLEIMAMAHLQQFVESPFKSRGGLVVVSPAGQLKTALLMAIEQYPGTLLLSDLNVQQFGKIKDDIVAKKIRTIIFEDLRKLGERSRDTALHVFGILRALVDQGYRSLPGQDSRVGTTATAVVIAGAQQDFIEDHWDEWKKNGFARRFLWARYVMEKPELLTDAVISGKMLELGLVPLATLPGSKTIQNGSTPDDRRQLVSMLRFQGFQSGADAIPAQIWCKMYAALAWAYGKRKEKRNPMQTMREFAGCFQKEPAEMILQAPIEGGVQHEREKQAQER